MKKRIKIQASKLSVYERELLSQLLLLYNDKGCLPDAFTLTRPRGLNDPGVVERLLRELGYWYPEFIEFQEVTIRVVLN